MRLRLLFYTDGVITSEAVPVVLMSADFDRGQCVVKLPDGTLMQVKETDLERSTV